ncbi:transcription intermediary factor 1-beta-like [Ruditapes philippinarum]|uniref:transcription intermediary factor 1-beta-like n=1 Tax=Ruditapes philippinarum TaxID=129788 RepID=UPI00295A71D2|nr:transcription intermediary factor 1-beta-like [Ruditapes philippinarum]
MDVSGWRASNQPRSSSIDMWSEEDSQVYCQSCDQEGPRLPAHGYCTVCKEHLCEKCYTVHKTEHHILLDAGSMPKSLYQRRITSKTSQREELTTFCLKHSKEKIKLFCSNHKKLLCRDCVCDEHITSPCIVKHVSDLSGDIIDCREYQDILKALENISDKYSTIVEDVKRITLKSNSLVKDALADIKNFRQQINAILDEQERLAEDVANGIVEDNNKYLK